MTEPLHPDTCPAAVLRPPAGPVSVVLPLVGAVDGELTTALCTTVRAVLEARGAQVVTCDAAGAAADLRLVDALARMHVTARRLGCGIRVRGAAPSVALIVELAGLAGVLEVSVRESG